ncbi:MAG TPA: hypothetical protein VH796_13510 [Nitrososphaeraceae archaeon]|jgi:hypothetical protein
MNPRNNIWLDLNIKRVEIAATNDEGKQEKIQALSFAKECNGMKLGPLTNATVVDDAIKFVSAKQHLV